MKNYPEWYCNKCGECGNHEDDGFESTFHHGDYPDAGRKDPTSYIITVCNTCGQKDSIEDFEVVAIDSIIELRSKFSKKKNGIEFDDWDEIYDRPD